MDNISNNPFDITRKNFKPLILDGALGSYIQQKGFIPDNQIWMTKINSSHPEIIVQIHKEYIQAGAEIITTNTFRTNPSSLEKYEISDIKFSVKTAIKLAKIAIEDKKVLVAGSNPPAEDCYQKKRTLDYNKLEFNHQYHIDLLINNGVHFILNETQSHFDEIKIICKHCYQNNIPFIISLYLDNSLNILSGESLKSVISFISDSGPLAIGFNCIRPELLKLLREQVNFSFNWGFYLNCGSGEIKDKNISCGISPDDYIKTVKENVNYKPSFIGSCCGSNPEHTRRINELINGKDYN